MSVFTRRRRDEAPQGTPGGAAAEPLAAMPAATVPVARDPELGVPPFRPAATPPPPLGAAPSRLGAATAPSRALPAVTAAPAAVVGARSVGAAAVAPQGGGASGLRAEGGPERRTLVVGKGISLQGTVSDAERLVVEGTVESQMIQAAELLITHSGVFKGEVQIEEAEIAGTFDGTLTATGNLVIRATGKVMGVARCRRLQVEEGGQISGRMEMLTDAVPARGGPVAPAFPPASGPAPAPALRSPEPAEA